MFLGKLWVWAGGRSVLCTAGGVGTGDWVEYLHGLGLTSENVLLWKRLSVAGVLLWKRLSVAVVGR